MAQILKAIRDRLSSEKHQNEEVKYEALSNSPNQDALCVCNRGGSSTHVASSSQSTRMRIAVQVTISLVVLALWTALVAFYLARNPHLLHRYSGAKRLENQFPIVPTDFQEDKRYVESDPYDSPFWNPAKNENVSDSMSITAWNYYGNSYVWLHKDDPYSIPGGRPLIPLYPEKDGWMKDYTGFITAYQHEIHCLGAIKNVLNGLKHGKTYNSGVEEHVHEHNDHCVEVIRHALSCQPDLTLEVETFDENGEHTPFWGGMRHMCRDRDAVHDFLGARNMGFKMVAEDDGREVLKAWAWPLPSNKFEA
ncbi:hypothetical protein K505DRAFT_366982 [Melanomma pulvis-pyrius CBS 109.77]|uniref:Uncharacterized protein n=1 Tax=Melanomma pulvis-pyrius CBS 109.77 TaxID=1314802 RepID=A0A6A6WUG5_9PLEO|nr:hypothetical protein K505DRAFT_366982 [Melanomma pulvis-pyrius CBS 109.77]